MMDFQQAESKFKQLKAQFEGGELTEIEFKNQLEELMVQDEAGSWWMIGFETEQWYRHDGSEWVQADPPESLSGQSPAEGEAAEKAARGKAEPEPSVDESVQGPGKVEPHKIETREASRAFSAPTIFGVGYAGIAGIIGVIALIIVIIVLASLNSNGTSSPTIPTNTHMSLPVISPTSTFTPTPTFTPTSTFTFTPTPTPFPPELSDIDPAGNPISMRLVSAGEFTMGSDRGDDDEKPPHRVYLDAFYMDKYEVTNASYKACVEVGECSQPEKTGHYNDPEYTNHPVVSVDWIQARAYCEWRGGNLPSEAQWEKAARGNDKRTYPWGEGIDCDRANYRGCEGDTAEVGSYASGVSPFGLYDMAGNVWEWVADWYNSGYYSTLADGFRDPPGPFSGDYRVLRGGSWDSIENYLRVSDRNPNNHVYSDNLSGFRCVRGTSP